MCQKVSNEVLLAWFTFQAKILSRSGVCIQGKFSRPSPLLSKDEGLNDIKHSMSIGNLTLGVMVTVSCLTVYYKMQQILLQNTTEVYYKMCQIFCYNRRQLLQITTTLLQIAIVLWFFNFQINFIEVQI